MKIGLASYPAGAGGQEAPDGTIAIRRYHKFAVIDKGTGAVVDNVTAFVWAKGKALAATLPENVEGEDESIIRSWANASERDGDKLFDQELDPKQDYLILAIPCSGAMECEGVREKDD